jgi:hypothetical protein
MIMELVVWTSICLLPFLLMSLSAFTSLVKLEYVMHRAEWEADGRPGGFFWMPDAGSRTAMRSGLTRSVLSLKWLFATPPWVRADARAGRLLRRFRTCVAVWNGGLVVAFLAGAIMLSVGWFPTWLR